MNEIQHKKPRRFSLRLPRIFRTSVFRLALGLLLVFSFTAVFSLGYVVWKSSTLVDEQVKATVTAESENLGQLVQSSGLRRLVATLDERAMQPNALLYLLTMPNGQPLLGNMVEWPVTLLEKAGTAEITYTRLASTNASAKNPPDTAQQSKAWVQVQILPGGFRLVVGQDLSERIRLVRVLVQAALGGLLLIVVLGFTGGFLISRRMITRLNGITRASQHIMSGNLEQRLPVQGSGDEFDQLALATNAMLERIAGLMQELREMGDNIAHDLKTPLTRLRSRAEEALRNDTDAVKAHAALENIIQDSDALLATFNAILMLARLEASTTSSGVERLDARALVQDLHELYEPVAEEAGVAFTLQADNPVFIEANRELLSQALANLIDNALKYGKAGKDTPAALQLIVEKKAGQCRITVTDNGKGIPPDQFQHVLERFVRLEQSRTQQGTGLGLSIVQAIMRYHQGSIEFFENKPHGLIVLLTLPLAAETRTVAP